MAKMGQPQKEPEKRESRLSVATTKTRKARVKIWAQKLGVSVGDLVNEVLERALNAADITADNAEKEKAEALLNKILPKQ